MNLNEFTSAKRYDDLNFTQFVAGKLETIIHTANYDEHDSRLRILLMNIYHSQFLSIKDIKDQYDVVMKQIERQELDRGNNLADRVDRALDRRLCLRDQKIKKNERNTPQKTAKCKTGGKSKGGIPVL